MFIRTPKGGKDRQYTYVQLAENYYDEDGKKRQRVVKNFGRLDKLLAKDPLAYEKIVAQFEADKAAKYQAESAQLAQELNSFLSSLATDGRKLVMCSLIYGHYVLRKIWDALGLDGKLRDLQKYGMRIKYSLKDALYYLVVMKALFPKSIVSCHHFRTQFLGDPLGAIGLDDLYDSYDRIHDCKDRITKWINKKLDSEIGSGRTAVIYYDVTNCFFESPLTDAERDYKRKEYPAELLELAEECASQGLFDENCYDKDGNLVMENLPDSFFDLVDSQKIEYLRMRGPSKEKRTDLPLISIALIIDRYGIPLDVKVYAGNASEFKTMKKSIDSLKPKYGIEKTVFVADRGLNSKANLSMISGLGYGYLIAQKITELSESLTKQLLDIDTYLPIDPDNPEAGKYKEIKGWKRTMDDGEDPVVCNLVFTWNEKRKKRDDAILDAWVKLVEKKAKQKAKIGRKRGWASIAKTDGDTEKTIIGVDAEALEKKRKYCGFAGVVYDAGDKSKFSEIIGCPQEAKDFKPVAVQAANAYHELNKIEDCFKCMKSYFGLRPVWVWNSMHVESHVYVCFLALLLVRLLQRKLKMAGVKLSLEKVLESLRNAKVIASVLPGDNATFISAELDPLPLGVNPWMSRDEVCKLIEESDPKKTELSTILEAVGLKEPPTVCRLGHLEDALDTMFFGLEGAIPKEWLEHIKAKSA